MAKNKQTKIPSKTNSSKKTVQLNNPDNYDKLYASWRFSKINLGCKWCLSQNDWKHWELYVLPKLRDFEKMTWSEIKSIPKATGGTKHHNIEITRLTKEAQSEMQNCNLIYDEIFSLRLTGVQRIFGILEKGVLDIVWFDDKHEICPSHKKHT